MENKRTCEDAVYSARALQTALSGVLGEGKREVTDARGRCTQLTDLLACADEDLAAMYLTDKHNGVVRSVSDHQTAELLLEYYERRIDENAEASLRLASLLDGALARPSCPLQALQLTAYFFS